MSSAENYKRILQEIAEEATRAGRNPDEIKLLAVSKTHSWQNVSEVYDAGCRTFGENRVQEALEKKEQLPKDAQWHLIGTLQKNKVNKAVGVFDLIHSVDTFDLAEKISAASQLKGIETRILLQVNVSGEATKHGFTEQSVQEVFPRLILLPHLKIEGLMTMAPYTANKEECLHYFQKLRSLCDQLGLKELSMGMSNDWREALHAGATLLRIGSSIFGSR